MKKLDKPNILIVDTRLDECHMVETVVEKAGACGLSAQSLEEARHVLKTIDINLILIGSSKDDSLLSDMARELNDHHKKKETPFMAVCDEAWDEKTIDQAYKNGVVDILVKPLNHLVIKNKCKYLIRNHDSEANDINESLLPSTMTRAFSSIAHQINNELTLIAGTVELFIEGREKNQQLSTFSSNIFKSVKRITAYTYKLMSLTKTETVELNKFLYSISREFNVKKNRITVEMDNNPERFLIEADKNQAKLAIRALFQIILELVMGNSIIKVKSSYISSDEVNTIMKTTLVGDWVLIEIRANGIYPAPETGDQRVEPLIKAKLQDRRLEMASIYDFISQHKGFIKVNITADRGLLFRIFLPLVERRKPKILDFSRTSVKATGTVLIIDKDDIIHVTEGMLKRLGYHFVTAKTGKEAIELVKKTSIYIDIALLSTTIPDMAGVEIFSELIKVYPDIKVVVCSGFFIDDDPVKELLNKGAHAFLQKPFSLGALSEVLQTNIERRKHIRHKVKDGMIAFIEKGETQKKKLIDISKGGAAVYNQGATDYEAAWKKMVIHAEEGAFQIRDLPFKFLLQAQGVPIKSDHGSKPNWMNLRFGELTESQIMQVDDFISKYTIK